VPSKQGSRRPRNSARSRPWKRLRQRVTALVFGERILCDTCKYDYGDACRRSERPNATVCEDYERG